MLHILKTVFVFLKYVFVRNFENRICFLKHTFGVVTCNLTWILIRCCDFSKHTFGFDNKNRIWFFENRIWCFHYNLIYERALTRLLNNLGFDN